jgi:aminopeptidase N
MQPLYGRWREGNARYATMLADQRKSIANLRPVISGKVRTEEEVYELNKGGPGQDIYYKGSWMLHALRALIGDRAFRSVTRLAVYGRIDPRPGNFTPRYTSSDEYERIVRRVTGKDYGWFFDVYLRQAALPDLIATRTTGGLSLRWDALGGRPFPMPVDVQSSGRVVHVPMTGGIGSLSIAKNAHVVIDPDAKLLRRSVAIEQYQAWRDAEARRAKAAN